MLFFEVYKRFQIVCDDSYKQNEDIFSSRIILDYVHEFLLIKNFNERVIYCTLCMNMNNTSCTAKILHILNFKLIFEIKKYLCTS